MKAWVLKNKEGKYWDATDTTWGDLCYAALYGSRGQAAGHIYAHGLADAKPIRVEINEVEK